jgi:endonuclease III
MTQRRGTGNFLYLNKFKRMADEQQQQQQQQQLAALRGIGQQAKDLVHHVARMNEVAAALNTKIRSVERKLGLVYTPFQASIFEYVQNAHAENNRFATNAPPL